MVVYEIAVICIPFPILNLLCHRICGDAFLLCLFLVYEIVEGPHLLLKCLEVSVILVDRRHGALIIGVVGIIIDILELRIVMIQRGTCTFPLCIIKFIVHYNLIYDLITNLAEILLGCIISIIYLLD